MKKAVKILIQYDFGVQKMKMSKTTIIKYERKRIFVRIIISHWTELGNNKEKQQTKKNVNAINIFPYM